MAVVDVYVMVYNPAIPCHPEDFFETGSSHGILSHLFSG